jgi:hypothetical protein
MRFVAETNTGRLRSFVKHHVTDALISLTLGGIASLAGAQVATLPESSTSSAAAITQDQPIRNIVLSTVPGRTVPAGGAFTTFLSKMDSMSASSKSRRRPFLILNDGTSSGLIATQSKSQAPATQSMCHTPRKSQM